MGDLANFFIQFRLESLNVGVAEEFLNQNGMESANSISRILTFPARIPCCSLTKVFGQQKVPVAFRCYSEKYSYHGKMHPVSVVEEADYENGFGYFAGDDVERMFRWRKFFLVKYAGRSFLSASEN
ncbi:MAG: hypothetical protein KKB30_09725 [Proteobacteria bacterium]|nr:hypothetical protein [Pseudomonadota bacterium]MBU1716999.1 hypothetical protein [Pseudomonadota bacterium]